MRCSFILGTSAIETLACLSALEVDGVTWVDGRVARGAYHIKPRVSAVFRLPRGDEDRHNPCMQKLRDILVDGSSALGMVPPLL